MKMRNFINEDVRIDWELRQKHAENNTIKTGEFKMQNKKKAQKFGYTYEAKQTNKYGFDYTLYIDDEYDYVA